MRKSDGAKITMLWITAVAAAALLPYVPSLRGGFALDDFHLIVEYPLAHSLVHLPEAFARSFLPGDVDPEVVYYRPLVIGSYQADYMIAGPNPFVFRLSNLLMHVAASLLMFALARGVTRDLVSSGLAGVAFGVLPSHFEAVSWVSGRTDLMSSIFTLGAVLVFAGFCDGTRISDDAGLGSARPSASAFRLFAFALLAACALFSKENAVVLPVLAFGYAWVFGCRMSRTEKIKWAAAFLVPMAVFVLVRRHAVHVTVVSHPTMVLGRRILGIGIAYAAYLRMLLVPQVGRVAYDVFPIGMKYPLISIGAWLAPTALAAGAIRLRKRLPAVAFGALWVFVALLPVSNILPATSPIPAERFVYLPSAGSSIVLGLLAKWMLDWRPRRIRIWPAAAVVIVVWYVLLCGALTIQSTPQYSSNLAWARAVSALDGRFYRSWSGYYFLQAGLFREAAREYTAAIERSPKPELSDYIGLSKAMRGLGEAEKALDVLLEARAKFGPSAGLELNLGNAYAEAGRPAQARRAFERAVRLDPQSAAAWVGLARIALALRDYTGAVTAYSRAESVTQLIPADRLRFGLACKKVGLVERALEQFRLAAAQDPHGKTGRTARQEIARIRR